MKIKIEWKKQARQLKFLQACGLAHPFIGGSPGMPVADVIGYGGAAGGGKTDALLVAAIVATLTYPGVNVGFFRREYPQLEGPGGAIMRSHELISKKWARWNGTQRRWTMPGGGIIQFCHCAQEDDVYNYQSQQFDVLLFDEVTQFTRFQVRYLITRNRATVDGIQPFTAWGSNPGNIGHAYIKAEFIDVGPPEQVHVVEVEPGQFERHIFIPSKLEDNQVLTERDPMYEKRLEAQPEHIRRMLRDGDWDVFAGQAFPEWTRRIHVIPPRLPKPHYLCYRSLDWGYSRPFSVGWWYIDEDGNAVRYRELYGCTGKPDEGVRKDPYAVGERIAELETREEQMVYGIADKSCWYTDDGGEPVIHLLNKALLKANLVPFNRQADKRKGSRLTGKMQLHYRLKNSLTGSQDEQSVWRSKNGIYVCETCKDFIRTIPQLIYDEKNVEDVDTSQEDHIYDETRYFLASKPVTPDAPKEDTREYPEEDFEDYDSEEEGFYD